MSFLKHGVVAVLGALGLMFIPVGAASAAAEGAAQTTSSTRSAVRQTAPAASSSARKAASKRVSTNNALAKVKKSTKASRRITSARQSRRAARQAAIELDDRVGETLILRSSSALVIDQRTGEVLFEKNAGQAAPIASITKLMTSMVVLDAAQDLSEVIAIQRADIDRSRGSQSRLHVGFDLTREQAMLLALMSSENRAAHALGRNFPGGLDAFVEAMNQKAQALGMANTQFVDPTGLSSKNVSTALDLAKMVAAAHEYPLIRELSTTPLAKLEVGKRHRLMGFSNTNALVKSAAWDIGLSKTGYISEAGKCLVMQAWVAGRPTVLVLLDSWGRLTRIGDANRVKRWLEKNDALAARIEPRA